MHEIEDQGTVDRAGPEAGEAQAASLGGSMGGWIVDAVLIPLAIALVFLAPYAAGRFREILSRPFWLDEIHTALIVDDPSLSHALYALANGADYNPPTFYLLCKAFRAITGTSGALSLRLVSLGSLLVGLLGIYATLRGVYPRLVAMAGGAAVWSHPIPIHHGFEARYYAPWFAMVAWLCWALNRLDGSPRHPRVMQAVIAVLAMLVCMIHYFGIFSLALVVSAHLLSRPRTLGSAARILAPAACGPAALLALIPLYRSQKATLSVSTWIPRPTLASIKLFLEALYPFHIVMIVVVAYFLHLLAQARRNTSEKPIHENRAFADLYGLASLLLLPLVLVAFSLLVQPALMGRYAVATSLSFGALVAPILFRSGRTFQAMALGLFLAAVGGILFKELSLTRSQVETRREWLAALTKSGNAPVIFRKTQTLYECWWDGPAARRSWYLLELKEASNIPNDGDIVQQNVAANLHRLYAMPKIVGIGEMATCETFYLFDFAPSQVDRIVARNPRLTAWLIDEKLQFYRLTRGTTPLP